MPLTITPLYVGQSRDVPLANALYGHAGAERICINMYLFVIEGGDAPIVVDTGTLSPDYVTRHHPYDFVRDDEYEPAKVLRAHGVEPDEVRIVVNTHLHWDHCSNNALFRNARVLVQRKELEYAIDPLPVHRKAYEKLPGLQAPWMAGLDRMETVTGEVEVAAGVALVPLPGHTPGSQGVLVDTAAGRYLVAGDAVGVYQNVHPRDWRESIAPTIHTNLFDCYETFERIAALDCEVIPSHDERVLANAPFGVPRGRELVTD